MGMNVNLTPQLEELVRSKVASGMYTSASEVVREALRLMDDQDRVRAAKLEQLNTPGFTQPVIEKLEIQFRPDPVLWDGKPSNNGWLQELPKPITNLTWDNAALVSPRTAEEMKFFQNFAWTGGERGSTITDIAELTVGVRKLKVAVHVQPGYFFDMHHGAHLVVSLLTPEEVFAVLDAR